MSNRPTVYGLVIEQNVDIRVAALQNVLISPKEPYVAFDIEYLSLDMTKPIKRVCAQRRLRSACASAQSDQSLRCPHEETLGP